MTAAGNDVATLIAARRGDERPAYVEGFTGATLSWVDVAARAEQWVGLAADFEARRGRDGLPASGSPRVGLLVSDPLEMIAAYLGALAAGITVAPLDPAATSPELATKAEVLGLAAVVRGTDDGGRLDEVWAAAGVEVWQCSAAGVHPLVAPGAGVPAAAGPRRPSGAGAALVLASSGTTGTPKLIALSAAELLHTAHSVVAHHRLSPHDRAYSPLPLFHINGLVVGALAALVGGHRLVVDRRFSASRFWDVVADQHITWLNVVPAIISVLVARPAPPPEVTARIRFARSASAPLGLATLDAFEDHTGIVVVETYGMTEAGSQITTNPPERSGRRPGSVGRPAGIDLRVVDGEHRVVADGAIGEIQISGPSVISCYWTPAGSPQPSRPARSSDGWLSTGDLGYLDMDGYLYLVGRADDVINRGGEKVYPREIEEVLLGDPAVETAAVVGRPDPTVGEVPVAFVLARRNAGPIDPGALAARLAARCDAELSRFRRPVEIVVADELPSGPNGKIRRSELCRPEAGARA